MTHRLPASDRGRQTHLSARDDPPARQPPDGINPVDALDHTDRTDGTDRKDRVDEDPRTERADGHPPVRPAPPAGSAGSAGSAPSARSERREAERREPDRVLPTWTDPVSRAASTLVGGPWGRHGTVGRQWFWTPLRVCLALAVVVLCFAWVFKSPCKDGAWTASKQYTHMCYSDVVPLFFSEQLNVGAVPYQDHAVEYPVLTGGFMYLAARLSHAYDGAAGGLLPGVNPVESYFDVTALLLAGCALVVIWSVTRLTGRRPWDAAMVALSPVLFVHAFTNWDLLAVALSTLALVAWRSRRPAVAGVLLGLGTAAKLYPVLFLVPLLLLCWRARRWRPFGLTVAGAAGAWLVVNIPVALAYPRSWSTFFQLNQTRPADPDTLWNVLQFATGRPLDSNLATGAAPVVLNTAVFLAFAAALAGIAVLTLTARRAPRLPQLLFLVVAAFLLTNKVWSPQYSLWLVPLAVLARPSWRAYLAWQATEALLWFPRMYWYLGTANKGIDEQWFLLAVLIRDAAVLVYCVLVVRDILTPERDIVRTTAGSAGSADPAGPCDPDDPAGAWPGESDRSGQWSEPGEPGSEFDHPDPRGDLVPAPAAPTEPSGDGG